MKINLTKFLSLRFRHEYHDYHREGTQCIYQDLIKNKKTIREILFLLKENPEYLNIEKYNHPFIKYDHMIHYIFCILYGFRKGVVSWREKDSKLKLIDKDYYLSKEIMDTQEINDELSNNMIHINNFNYITDGYHRCFCMIGRLLRNEPYIPFTFSPKRFYSLLNNKYRSNAFSPKISNVGYRTAQNRKRLRLIKEEITSSKFSLLDVGSNYGFFSLSLALNYPESKVYSVEGSFGTGNKNIYQTDKSNISKSKGIVVHRKLKEKHSIFNNTIFCSLLTQDTISLLKQKNIIYNYQLSLSVFHWVVYEKYKNSGKPEDIYDLLVDYLNLAKTTFIELPDFKQSNSLTPIYNNHETIHQLFAFIKKRYKLDMDIKLLGQHNWYGKRSLFKITLKNLKPTKDIAKNNLNELFKPLEVL